MVSTPAAAGIRGSFCSPPVAASRKNRCSPGGSYRPTQGQGEGVGEFGGVLTGKGRAWPGCKHR